MLTLLIDGVILAPEGECPSCTASAPITQNDNGETVVDCANPDCNSRGVAGEKCVVGGNLPYKIHMQGVESTALLLTTYPIRRRGDVPQS